MCEVMISVVIPTLDEQQTLGSCLDSVGESPEVEIVVSDGGSSDDTETIAIARPGVKWIRGPRGRGPQLNRGAEAAAGRDLLFLHADCRLPEGWRPLVSDALADTETALACFRLHTEPTSAAGVLGRVSLRLLDLRSRGFGLPYGDQGLALRKSTFETIGGFPEIPLMEDVEMSRALHGVGRLVRIDPRLRVITSSRRFRERGLLRQTLLNAFNMFRYLYLGATAEDIARSYRSSREVES